MKKIGLAVCYDTKNFGSQLQVLATIKKIEQYGCKTEIIRYKKKMSINLIAQNIPRLFNIYFIRNKINSRKKRKSISVNTEILSSVKIRNKRFIEFAKKYFKNISEQYNGWKELKDRCKKEYDAFLCGSDQLWLPSNLESHFYTLEFAPENKPKIAYATSFGVSQIPWYQKKRTKKYLKRFTALSSREIKGTEIIKSLTGKDIPVVCDPTLLLSKEEWDKIIPEKNVIEDKYIFCYFLGNNEEHRIIANTLKDRTGYKIVTIPFLDNYVEIDKKFGDFKMFDIDTEDFVNLIRNAEYVLTDSFHGSIFSILNHKKFIIFNRFSDKSKNSRNSRIESLCRLLHLEDRRYKNDIVKSIERDIDYKIVDEALTDLRNDSEEYLKESLNQLK